MTVVPRYKEYEEAIDTGVRIRLNVLGQDVEVGFFHHYLDGVDIVFVDHNSYNYVRDSIYSFKISICIIRFRNISFNFPIYINRF